MLELYRITCVGFSDVNIASAAKTFYYINSRKTRTVSIPNKFSSGSAAQIFAPIAIKSSEWTSSPDKSEVQIVIYLGADIIEPWKSIIQHTNNYRIEVDLFNVDGNLINSGRLYNVEFLYAKHEIKLFVRTLGSIGNADIPNRRFSTFCPFQLGDDLCLINKSLYEKTFSASGYTAGQRIITNAALQTKSATHPIDPGGSTVEKYWEYLVNGLQHVYITKHNDDTIYLANAFDLPLADANFKVFPGCHKTINYCQNEFDNEIRYGGSPMVPFENPVINRIDTDGEEE